MVLIALRAAKLGDVNKLCEVRQTVDELKDIITVNGKVQDIRRLATLLDLLNNDVLLEAIINIDQQDLDKRKRRSSRQMSIVGPLTGKPSGPKSSPDT